MVLLQLEAGLESDRLVCCWYVKPACPRGCRDGNPKPDVRGGVLPEAEILFYQGENDVDRHR